MERVFTIKSLASGRASTMRFLRLDCGEFRLTLMEDGFLRRIDDQSLKYLWYCIELDSIDCSFGQSSEPCKKPCNQMVSG